MVGVGANAQVETFLAGILDKVLVGADTSGFKGLRAQLLVLVGDEVDAKREVIDGGALAAQIVDLDLGVRHTTVEPRLGVRLETPPVSISSHIIEEYIQERKMMSRRRKIQ